jgi:hypothetical protein
MRCSGALAIASQMTAFLLASKLASCQRIPQAPPLSMRIPIGIFDFAAYAIPGAVYLAAVLLLGDLFWPAHDIWLWINNPTLSQVAIALVACYLLGHATYSFSTYRMPFEQSTSKRAREEFLARNPQFVGRPFVDGDPYLLLAVLEEKNATWGTSIGSVRATSIMCRSCATALFLLALLVGVHYARSRQLIPLAPCGSGLLLASILMRRAGRERVVWAKLKTLECAAWVEGIDARFGQAAVAPVTAPAVASDVLRGTEPSPQLEPGG